MISGRVRQAAGAGPRTNRGGEGRVAGIQAAGAERAGKCALGAVRGFHVALVHMARADHEAGARRRRTEPSSPKPCRRLRPACTEKWTPSNMLRAMTSTARWWHRNRSWPKRRPAGFQRPRSLATSAGTPGRRSARDPALGIHQHQSSLDAEAAPARDRARDRGECGSRRRSPVATERYSASAHIVATMPAAKTVLALTYCGVRRLSAGVRFGRARPWAVAHRRRRCDRRYRRSGP